MGKKTPVVLKRQQFDDSESEEMALIIYKRQWFNDRDDEEEQNLDEDEDDSDGNRYVLTDSCGCKKTHHFLRRKKDSILERQKAGNGWKGDQDRIRDRY